MIKIEKKNHQTQSILPINIKLYAAKIKNIILLSVDPMTFPMMLIDYLDCKQDTEL